MLTIGHMTMFVVISIVIQMNGHELLFYQCFVLPDAGGPSGGDAGAAGARGAAGGGPGRLSGVPHQAGRPAPDPGRPPTAEDVQGHRAHTPGNHRDWRRDWPCYKIYLFVVNSLMK